MTDARSAQAPASQGPIVVLDDDPTGTQLVAGVPVLLDWDRDRLREAYAGGHDAIFLQTNSRALAPEAAREVVRGAAEAAASAFGRPRLLLRGDSTLRGHLIEEYDAVRDVVDREGRAPLLLVPALPTAGRITVGGVHQIVRDGVCIPLDQTEYARDPQFGYSDARLLQWAQERSGGRLQARAGREIELQEIRSERGAESVAAALLELAGAPEPGVCAPDAATIADLVVIADGLRRAEVRGASVVTRCAPAFAAVLADALATELVSPPSAPRGVLVLCGSWVPLSTRQLEAVREAYPESCVEADVAALVSERAADEVDRVARAADERLRRDRLAVVATSRGRPQGARALQDGEVIAAQMASVLHRIDLDSVVVVAKGGITSAVTARIGLRASRADVVGPLVDGVSLWRVHGERGLVPYIVFPGNVGEDRTLRTVVDRVLAS